MGLYEGGNVMAVDSVAVTHSKPLNSEGELHVHHRDVLVCLQLLAVGPCLCLHRKVYLWLLKQRLQFGSFGGDFEGSRMRSH